jgi:hypothetical protein
MATIVSIHVALVKWHMMRIPIYAYFGLRSGKQILLHFQLSPIVENCSKIIFNVLNNVGYYHLYGQKELIARRERYRVTLAIV